MIKTCAIITGGEISPFTDIENADFVIACDRGYGYAKDSGIIPDLIIGDFDSYKSALPSDIPLITLPCEKDETDTMAAVKYAVKNGFGSIMLFCALGGRLDHLLGNLQSAAYAAERGTEVRIYDFRNEIYVISNAKTSIPKKSGFSVSLIALSDRCEDVSVHGGKYPLSDAVLTNRETLGISNEWIDDLTVSVGTGVLAIVMSKMNAGEKK